MNFVKLSKYFGLYNLYNLYVSMFQCFTETNGWPGISAGFLCNICKIGQGQSKVIFYRNYDGPRGF